MPEPNITGEAARMLIRGLSGTENYPFHVEGEDRLAAVLVEHCAGIEHARYTIAEFDEAEKCPTVEALRSAARRLAEVCECGKAKWAHREPGACKRFMAGGPDGDGLTKTAGGFAKFRESVRMIEGVGWETALQIETIRIDLGLRGSPPDHQAIEINYKRYPEAVGAIRAGREPDAKLVEAQMRALFPRIYRRSKESRRDFATLTVDRLADMDKNYAVESITPES